MDALYNVFLGFHIAGGFTALFIGIIAYVTLKGSKYHKLAGRIYFGGMLLVIAGALLMNTIKPNTFLFYIALFTLYLVYGGVRSTKNKNLQPQLLDILFFILGVIVAALMILTKHIVLIVFGLLFILTLYGDLRIYLMIKKEREIPKNQWLMRHIGLISGSYIATSTAFLTVNFQEFEPFWLPWLLPSIIGVPLIFYFQKRISEPKKK